MRVQPNAGELLPHPGSPFLDEIRAKAAYVARVRLDDVEMVAHQNPLAFGADVRIRLPVRQSVCELVEAAIRDYLPRESRLSVTSTLPETGRGTGRCADCGGSCSAQLTHCFACDSKVFAATKPETPKPALQRYANSISVSPEALTAGELAMYEAQAGTYRTVQKECEEHIARILLGAPREDRYAWAPWPPGLAPQSPTPAQPPSRAERRRTVDAALAEDARRWPAFATARRAVVMAACEQERHVLYGAEETAELCARLRVWEDGRGERPSAGQMRAFEEWKQLPAGSVAIYERVRRAAS